MHPLLFAQRSVGVGAAGAVWVLASVLGMVLAGSAARAELLAGAAVVDVTPTNLPVRVNGGMLSRVLGKVKTRVHARAVVLADDRTRIALVVVDSCMMGRALLDEAKALASVRTGIATNRMLISATHAHSAPSSMGCLGTDAEPAYVPFLRDRIVDAILSAQANLEPARIGFGQGDAAEFTALRQWIRRPDRLGEDPFGNRTVRANMHAGANWDDVTGEAGPEDPALSLISIQARDGRPLAVLGNFSMHYFSDEDISADYFGLFAEGLRERLAPTAVAGKPAFVGILSHGCSGDIWRRDYTRPSSWDPALTIDRYAAGLLDIAMKAYAGIEHRGDVDLAMSERRLRMRYRVPDKQRLEWARRVMGEVGDRELKTTTEVYAREQILLHETPETEVVVQGIRVGDIGISAVPTETYAVTGLKIKAASPLERHMVIELANGGDGYIPPPEQHLFGGYNTWAARSAGLEVSAEPRLAEAAIELAEEVSGRPRRGYELGRGPASEAVAALNPLVWWRLNEFTGPHAVDASGHGRDAVYEREITYYLAGPGSSAFCGKGEVNRAPHFVGGRLRARLGGLGNRYTVALWIWNGMPNEARGTSGWFFSRGHDHGLGPRGEHLGVGGTNSGPGRLVFQAGREASGALVGRTVLPRWEWHHVVLVRDGETVRVHLDGNREIEGRVGAGAGAGAGVEQIFVGGRTDNEANWEGRLDEVAVFDRALGDAEVAGLSRLKE